MQFVSDWGEMIAFYVKGTKQAFKHFIVLWDNRSSYKAYPNIFSTYQNFTD